MREERAGMLKWDDDSKTGVNWGNKQNFARKKIRVLLGSEEDSNIDLTGYDLGTVRTLRDYEKYAGIHFKNMAVQKYTLENKYPPNPVIKDEKLWEQSFDKSFYHLVNAEKYMFADSDYSHILIAYDDENGLPLQAEYIKDQRLVDFNNGANIHYEDFFITTNTPSRVVYWAFSDEKGWCERIEHKL
jgi:hypothetical protein